MAIISGGGIVARRTVKNAGEHMNSLIANYCYLKYGIVLGESTVEDIKLNLLNFSGEDKTVTVRGKSLENGLPKSVRLKSSEVKEALLNNFNQILDTVKELIEASPPEIVEDIYDRGIILAGELTQIEGIEKFFTNELKIECMIAPHAGNTTIYGLLNIAKDYENMIKLSVNSSAV
jgi:rod shape-determining protein MreB